MTELQELTEQIKTCFPDFVVNPGMLQHPTMQFILDYLGCFVDFLSAGKTQPVREKYGSHRDYEWLLLREVNQIMEQLVDENFLLWGHAVMCSREQLQRIVKFTTNVVMFIKDEDAELQTDFENKRIFQQMDERRQMEIDIENYKLQVWDYCVIYK